MKARCSARLGGAPQRGCSDMAKRKTIAVPPQTRAMLARVVAKLKPPPTMTLSQWADKERRLSQGASALPGRWRTDKAPYQRGMMDAISDPIWE